MTAVFKMKSELKSQISFISWLRITLQVLGMVKFTSSPSGVYVVNALLPKLLSNPYLSRYNSVSFSYQCLTQIQSHDLSMSIRHYSSYSVRSICSKRPTDVVDVVDVVNLSQYMF